MPSTPELFVSGYTEDGQGAGPGLARFALADDGTVGEQTAAAQGMSNPSFLFMAGGVLLAAEELAQGNVVALDPQTLEVLGRTSSRGADTCHVTLIDGFVWAANYSSGNTSVTPLAQLLDGSAPEAPELLSHPGSGPVADRQGESHAHQVVGTQWDTVLVADLGADRVDEYSASSRVRLESAELPPGTGPRHVALKGDFLLVAGELDGHLHVLQRTPVAHVQPGNGEANGGGHFWRWLFSTPLAESAADIAAAGEFFPSHIELSADGRLLYAAVRGPNTVVALDVSDLPARPKLLGMVPSGGNWPRHFAVAPAGNGSTALYVANQMSNNVAVFTLDGQGLPGSVPVQLVDFPSPACILPR